MLSRMHRSRVHPHGHSYPSPDHTVIIVNGVVRFTENRIITDLADGRLSAIASAVQHGRYTVQEQAEVWRLMGCSLDGFADVFPMERR